MSSSSRTLLIGIITGSIITVLASRLIAQLKNENKEEHEPTTDIVEGVDGLIGNTPLMKIRSLSEATGCTILVCPFYTIICEYANKTCRERQR